MKNKKLVAALIAVFLGTGGFYLFQSKAETEEKQHAHEEHNHDHEQEEHSDSTEIQAHIAKNSGITTLESSAASIREIINLTGKVALNQNTTARVKARFPGIVREVKKGLGESVQKDDVLAVLEMNQNSLRMYSITAPVSGVILERNTNVGDVTSEQNLFIISDLRNLWAELYVFPSEVSKIKPGQKVHISTMEKRLTMDGIVESLLPVAEASSQTVIARISLPNTKAEWRTGMAVRGEVTVSEQTVPTAVKSSAIQKFEGNDVVFIKEGDTYTARQVVKGQTDPEWTEIKSGIQAGEIYVAEGSFIIKADIGKASAEHEH